MAYLTYEEYRQMGGSLDNAAFAAAERKARYLINAQAGGSTGERIAALPELPQAVRDCTFELAELIADNSGRQISSESQSQGGTSESVSYVAKNEEEITAELEGVIYNYLIGVMYKGVSVLYWGACI